MRFPPAPFSEPPTSSGHNEGLQVGDEAGDAYRESGVLVTQLADKSQSRDLKSRLCGPACTVPTVPLGPVVSQEVEAGVPGGEGTCREEVEGKAQGVDRACFWRRWSRSTVWQSLRLQLLAIEQWSGQLGARSMTAFTWTCRLGH